MAVLNNAGMGKKFVMDVETTKLVWKEKSPGGKRPEGMLECGASTVSSIWEENRGKAVRIALRRAENGTVTVEFWAWRAWPHHMALVGMAMAFALGERLRLEPGNPLISTRDVVEMVAWYFQEKRSAADVEAGIKARHRRRKLAMECKIRREASQGTVLTM